MFNNIFKLFIFGLFAFSVPACSKDIVHDAESMPVTDNNLSAVDLNIINEYNEISNKYINEKIFKQDLKDFFPKALAIENDDARDNIVMNIYVQTGELESAYILNEQLIKRTASFSKQIYGCQLLELQRQNKNTIQNCYGALTELAKENFSKADKSDPLYIHAEWSYLELMYKAGHVEYKKKMEDFIDATNDEVMKLKFQSLYDLAIDQQGQ